MGVAVSHDDTIVAIASPHGSAERGIVRVSGSDAVACISKAFIADNGSDFESIGNPESLAGLIRLGNSDVPGRLSIWPDERSYTGQPSAEFHTFGSIPVLELVTRRLCELGARPAEPGEFTMRAFLSGRLDLTQAEAVLAVIESNNRKQLDVAIEQLAGGIGGQLSKLRDELLSALAELEAGLDFVEEDIEFISSESMIQKLQQASNSIDRLIRQSSERDAGSAGFRVSLFGLPNAGKSSLFNRLANRDMAIVADVEGTTTDLVTIDFDIQGRRVELVDTAGLEEPSSLSPIAAASQDRRKSEWAHCDLALLCVDAMSLLSDGETKLKPIEAEGDGDAVVVITKIDRLSEFQREKAIATAETLNPSLKIVATSSLSGAGVEELRIAIRTAAVESQSCESGIVGSTMLRTTESLRAAHAAIAEAHRAAVEQIGDEVVASEVRIALDHLGLIVGAIYTDDVLDVVFGKFCIGK